jgi:hypothetical protein
MPHLSATHHETSKRDSPHKIDSRVEPQKLLEFKFKPRQVNYSSQANQGSDHLVSQYLMMQSLLWRMVHTRTFEDPILYIPESSNGRGHGQASRGNAPPLPPRTPVSRVDRRMQAKNRLNILKDI